jgi:glyoxalase family protein
MVKVTVNFDDPQSYHLYYGDSKGSPGSLLTFFEWKHLDKGKQGYGLWGRLIFSVPPNSLEFWKKRLDDKKIGFEEQYIEEKNVLFFKDYDGMNLGLIEEDKMPDYYTDEVGKENSIIRMIGMEMILRGTGDDIILLNNLGYDIDEELFKEIKTGDSVIVYSKDNSFIEIKLSEEKGIMGSGSIHHVAYRAKDEEQQLEIREKLRKYNPTEVVERIYFRSVYFRSPQGLIFEIATDEPGMGIDEAILGSSLKLPPWYEEYREQITKGLTPVRYNAK